MFLLAFVVVVDDVDVVDGGGGVGGGGGGGGSTTVIDLTDCTIFVYSIVCSLCVGFRLNV